MENSILFLQFILNLLQLFIFIVMNKIKNTNFKNTDISLPSKDNKVLNSSTLASFMRNYCHKAVLALAICIGTSSISEAQNADCSTPTFGQTTPAAYNLDVLNPSFSGFSSVAAADMDADGDIDLIVGDDTFGALRYLQNTGSATNPFYSAIVNISSNIGFETYVTIGDLDGDGDFDIMYGRWINNNFFYVQNTGTPTNPVFAAPVQNPFGLATLPGQLSPELVDLDGDGDLDIVCGNDAFGLAANVTYIENIGSATAPNFNFAGRLSDPFGFNNIPGTNDFIKLKQLDFDGDGDIDFVYGNSTTDEMGFLINIGSRTAPQFIDLGTDLGLDENISTEHSPLVLDIDFDGEFEAIVGSVQGDLVTYEAFKKPIISILQGTSVTACEPTTLELVSSNVPLSAVNISWLDAAGNVVGTNPTFTTPDPSQGSLLYRAVVETNEGCRSDFTTYVQVSCNSQVVINLSVTPGYNQAQLSWEVLGSRPVVEYEVYVSFDGGTPNILYGTTTSKTYLADALLNGVNTSFNVVAVYDNGTRSLASNTVTVRPSIILGEEDASEKGFAFFPNPNNGEFNLKLQDGSTTAKVSVISLSGQRVYTSNLTSTQTSINLTNVASGMYIVRVETEQGIYQQKVSVVR